MRITKAKISIPSNENSSKNPGGPIQMPDHLHQKAFDNSYLANIISVESNGKIIASNHAAGTLLGYRGKGLLSKKFDDIFIQSDGHFKRMLKHRESAGHATGNLTVIKKNGKQLPCQITSVLFTGDNQIRKAITTFVDRSDVIRRQTEIDLKKEKKTAAEIISALSKSDATLDRLHNLEHTLDEEITAKEVSLSASVVQRRLFDKAWKSEIKLKAVQIANAVTKAKQSERTDLGQELHDNVNQLLAASRIYMELARRHSKDRYDNICRSSEYTLTAIEAIRKLAKGLVTTAIKDIGLCLAIRKMTRHLMKAYPIKITCRMDSALNNTMSQKLNLDVFRIAQEQLSNIIKHAEASRVKIDLTQNKVAISLSIADNGIGFDVTKHADGIGILNIKSRAAFYNGNANFVSEPGKGCVLTVSFPNEYSI